MIVILLLLILAVLLFGARAIIEGGIAFAAIALAVLAVVAALSVLVGVAANPWQAVETMLGIALFIGWVAAFIAFKWVRVAGLSAFGILVFVGVTLAVASSWGIIH